MLAYHELQICAHTDLCILFRPQLVHNRYAGRRAWQGLLAGTYCPLAVWGREAGTWRLAGGSLQEQGWQWPAATGDEAGQPLTGQLGARVSQSQAANELPQP